MFIAILRSVLRTGSLRVTDAAGRSHIVGDGTVPRAAIRLTSKRLEYSLLLNPSLSVGEAFMDGALVIEDGTLYDFLDVLARNFDSVRRLPWLAFKLGHRLHLRPSAVVTFGAIAWRALGSGPLINIGRRGILVGCLRYIRGRALALGPSGGVAMLSPSRATKKAERMMLSKHVAREC